MCIAIHEFEGTGIDRLTVSRLIRCNSDEVWITLQIDEGIRCNFKLPQYRPNIGLFASIEQISWGNTKRSSKPLKMLVLIF